MRKNFIGILVLSLFVLGFNGIGIASAQTYFSENFDSYPLNAFPSSGGWQLIYNGAGNSHQYIDNAQSVSGKQSLHLVGSSCWSAAVYHAVTLPTKFTLEGNIRMEKIVSCGCGWLATFGLNNPNTTHLGGFVIFECDGYIYHGDNGIKLMPYVEGTWYNIRIDIDLDIRVSNVYINGVLKASGVKIPESSGVFTGISLAAQHGDHPTVWFDDVSISDTTSCYDQGYAAGVLACLANPASCGINVNGGDAVTLTPDLKMHLPNIEYNTLLGIVSIWADLAYDSTKTDAVYFKVTGAGAN